MNLTKNQKALLQLRVATARDELTGLLDEAAALGLRTVVSPSRTRDGQHKMEIRLLNPVALSFQTQKGTNQ